MFKLQVHTFDTRKLYVSGVHCLGFSHLFEDAMEYEGRNLVVALKNLRERMPKAIITVLTVH